MADAVRPGPIAPAVGGHHHGNQMRSTAPHGGASFHHVLQAAVHMPMTRRTPNPLSIIPSQSDAALQQAMTLEGVPQSWHASLRYIMAQESGGQVYAKNPVHSARGLFQLTAAQYHLNPNGEQSFGNAVEEAQGGIRYIQQRYGTADKAVAYWRQHYWY